VTLGVGVFALAGIPPFVGFMGKLSLLSAVLAKGYLALVIIAVVNAAIAVYYYLAIIRESWLRDSADSTPIKLGWQTRTACLLLITGILALGIVPGRFVKTVSTSIACVTQPSPQNAIVSTPPQHQQAWSKASAKPNTALRNP
jgi:NADH-quinone oxidoreductase subunit N